ncbi:MAG TPA: hypothetical protein VLC09_14080, partial [Polyangiaceae bacterium]|nr:hypothetical protein [Polyangiaceae bacterium]
MNLLGTIERWGARPWRHVWTAALLGLAAAALALHEARYGNFFTDDGFISLRYTARLLHGQGLTWDDYERVEGYSNLLWVLLCAIPGAVGVDLVQGARGLGFAATIASFAALVHIVRPATLRAGLAAVVAVAFMLVSSSIAVWSTGGLEPPLLLALVLWALAIAGDERMPAQRRDLWVA